MSIPRLFNSLVGEWTGTNRLHLGDWKPEDPLHTSEATASIRERGSNQFLEIAYTWSYEGKPQEGVLFFGGDNKSNTVNAFWTDSWHMAHQLMMCEGKNEAEGRINLRGFYKVEGYPDWGWRTEIIAGENTLEYKMYNVSPEGLEEIAVEMDLKRM